MYTAMNAADAEYGDNDNSNDGMLQSRKRNKIAEGCSDVLRGTPTSIPVEM